MTVGELIENLRADFDEDDVVYFMDSNNDVYEVEELERYTDNCVVLLG